MASWVQVETADRSLADRVKQRFAMGTKTMYQALGREDTDLSRRALAHLRRERASEGFDDPQ